MSQYRASILCTIVLAICGASACTQRDRAQDASSKERIASATQRVRLDLDSAIADLNPTGFAVTDTRLYVLEGMAGRVLELDRHGGLMRVLGNRGSGPGEFQMPSAVVVLDKSVAIADARLGKMKFFGLDDGKFRGESAIPGATLSVAAHGDTVVGGYADATQRTTLYATAIGMATPRLFGALPEELEKNPRVAGLYPFVIVAPHANGFVQGFSARRSLQWLSAGGAVAGEFDAPATVRRGVPADLATRINNSEPRANLIDLTSNLLALAALPGERTAMVHVDYHKRTKGIGSTAFVSVVDGRGKSLCSDIRVPFDTTTARPTFAFHGDTLFVMQVTSEGAAGSAVAVSSMGLGRCA